MNRRSLHSQGDLTIGDGRVASIRTCLFRIHEQGFPRRQSVAPHLEGSTNDRCSQLPTILAKIYGFYRIGLRNPATGKVMRLDILVMEVRIPLSPFDDDR